MVVNRVFHHRLGAKGEHHIQRDHFAQISNCGVVGPGEELFEVLNPRNTRATESLPSKVA